MVENSKKGQFRRGWPGRMAIWRWHFYAGIFCIPFVMALSVTGAVYLFKPQIEKKIYEPYNQLEVKGHPASPEKQVEVAINRIPGSSLHSYLIPPTTSSAVHILVGKGDELTRVLVHPETLEILRVENEDSRLMRLVFRLHGELMLGDRGSMIVELAASWAIIMILTGLILWWPARTMGLAGVVYPRLTRDPVSKRCWLWRDLHAVTGFWVSFFALFLLISGLPWAKSWGGMLKELRQLNQPKKNEQDWTTGRKSEMMDRKNMNAQPASGMHAGHGGSLGLLKAVDYTPLNGLVATVADQQLVPPVFISPPSKKSVHWTARSETQNRPLRANLVLDGVTGGILEHKTFSDRPLLDRIISYGVAAHEGQLFGWFNQLLGLFTAVALILVCVSAMVMWIKRKPHGRLGAPGVPDIGKRAISFMAVVLLFGTLLPLLGLSILIVLIFEKMVLRKWTRAAVYLGLTKPA